MVRSRILCIDDYAPALNSLRLLLQTAGYEVVAASGSRELESLDQSPFDAVVIDYQMPGDNGEAVARKLKQVHPNLPIVMLSGYAADIPEHAARCVDAFVAKGPRTAQELTATLSALLLGRSATEPQQQAASELKRAAAQSLQLDDKMVDRFESKR